MADETKLPLSLEDLDKVNTPEEEAEQNARIKQEAELKVKKEAEDKAKAELLEKEKNSVKTQAELDEEAKVAKEKEEADKKALMDQAAEDEDFNQRVDKLHGFNNLKVEYGETDPLSPEGAFVREKAIIEKTRQDFETSLKQEDPRGYAYLLHRRSGKSDEDFFGTPSLVLPEYEVFKKDVDLQKNLYTKDLKDKGLSEDVVAMAVEKAIKDNKLFEITDKIYKGKEAGDKKLLETLENNNKVQAEAENQAISGMNTVLDDIITNSKVDNIVIPDTKKTEFTAFVKNNLFFDGKDFFIIKGLNKDNAAALIQAEYFGFVKGNLNEVVRRQAKTANAEAVRRRVTKDSRQPNTQDDSNVKTFTPLSDVN